MEMKFMSEFENAISYLKKKPIIKRCVVKISEISNFLKYYRNHFNNRDSLYLIYTPGKVGSSTIFSSLWKQLPYIPIFSIHYLEKYFTDKIEPTKYYIQIRKGQEFRNYLERNLKKRLKIITVFREPIGRDLSHFFQDFEFNTRAGQNESLGIKEITEIFQKSDNDYMFDWWEKDFKMFTKLDISKINFDKEKGYSIYKFEKFDLLVIRFESFKSILSTALEEFTSSASIQILNSNITSRKKHAAIYQELRSKKLFSRNYLKKYYYKDIIKNFYTNEEIESFIEKWSY
jgi:hypothetical protein